MVVTNRRTTACCCYTRLENIEVGDSTMKMIDNDLVMKKEFDVNAKVLSNDCFGQFQQCDAKTNSSIIISLERSSMSKIKVGLGSPSCLALCRSTTT